MTAPPPAWVRDYLAGLPELLRGNPDDSRYLSAARTAHAAGWTPAALAEAVTAKTRHDATAPAAYAMRVLSELAAEGPPRVAPDPLASAAEAWRVNLPPSCPHDRGQELELAPGQCGECRHAAGGPFWPISARPAAAAGRLCRICHQPECIRDALPVLPAAAAAERAELLADLAQTRGLTEAERESRMTALIRSQEGRLYCR